MQIKITMRYHFTPTRMAGIKKTIITNIDKDVEKREPSNSGGGVKWCSRSREQSGTPQNFKLRT